MDWSPYLTGDINSAMLFSMKHVRRDTPTGIHYMPSLCTFISNHDDALTFGMIKEHGIEPLMFMDNYWEIGLRVLSGLEVDYIIGLMGVHAPKEWIDSLPLSMTNIDAFVSVGGGGRNQFTPFTEFVNKIKSESPIQSICSLPRIHADLYQELLLKYLPALSLGECLKVCIHVIDSKSLDGSEHEKQSMNGVVQLMQRLILRSSDKVIRETDDFSLAWVVAKEREPDLSAKLLKRIDVSKV